MLDIIEVPYITLILTSILKEVLLLFEDSRLGNYDAARGLLEPVPHASHL